MWYELVRKEYCWTIKNNILEPVTLTLLLVLDEFIITLFWKQIISGESRNISMLFVNIENR